MDSSSFVSGPGEYHDRLYPGWYRGLVQFKVATFGHELAERLWGAREAAAHALSEEGRSGDHRVLLLLDKGARYVACADCWYIQAGPSAQELEVSDLAAAVTIERHWGAQGWHTRHVLATSSTGLSEVLRLLANGAR